MLEDEIAGMLTAREYVEDFEILITLLYQKHHINHVVYDGYLGKLDKIRDALQVGKRYIGIAHNRRDA